LGGASDITGLGDARSHTVRPPQRA